MVKLTQFWPAEADISVEHGEVDLAQACHTPGHAGWPPVTLHTTLGWKFCCQGSVSRSRREPQLKGATKKWAPHTFIKAGVKIRETET